jgi:flavodoxin
MKIMVTWLSQTGNTRKVAEAIFNALPGEKTMKPFDEVETLDGFDLTFIGFPVMLFGPPVAARKFIATLAAGRKIALFVTHAMFTTSDDPGQQAMLEKELERCRKTCANSNLIDVFHCQGTLSEKVAKELLSSNIPMLMEFAAMQPFTAGHPDNQELEQAAAFAGKVIAS